MALEWRELRRAVRAETGAAAGTLAWVVGIAGLAVGLELSERWIRGRVPRRKIC